MQNSSEEPVSSEVKIIPFCSIDKLHYNQDVINVILIYGFVVVVVGT